VTDAVWLLRATTSSKSKSERKTLKASFCTRCAGKWMSAECHSTHGLDGVLSEVDYGELDKRPPVKGVRLIQRITEPPNTEALTEFLRKLARRMRRFGRLAPGVAYF